jgi:hypothetical protein
MSDEEIYDEYLARKEQHEFDLLSRDYERATQEIATLKAAVLQLSEALEYYGDPENYIERFKDHWVHSSPCQKGDRVFIKNYKHPETDWIGTVGVGGKRARETMARYEELLKQIKESK